MFGLLELEELAATVAGSREEGQKLVEAFAAGDISHPLIAPLYIALVDFVAAEMAHQSPRRVTRGEPELWLVHRR
jgi:hypothetical protein